MSAFDEEEARKREAANKRKKKQSRRLKEAAAERDRYGDRGGKFTIDHLDLQTALNVLVTFRELRMRTELEAAAGRLEPIYHDCEETYTEYASRDRGDGTIEEVRDVTTKTILNELQALLYHRLFGRETVREQSEPTIPTADSEVYTRAHDELRALENDHPDRSAYAPSPVLAPCIRRALRLLEQKAEDSPETADLVAFAFEVGRAIPLLYLLEHNEAAHREYRRCKRLKSYQLAIGAFGNEIMDDLLNNKDMTEARAAKEANDAMATELRNEYKSEAKNHESLLRDSHEKARLFRRWRKAAAKGEP